MVSAPAQARKWARLLAAVLLTIPSLASTPSQNDVLIVAAGIAGLSAALEAARAVLRGRPGYWHFEQSHAKLLARDHACSRCHQDFHPYKPGSHKMHRVAVTESCSTCHGIQPSGKASE